MKDLMKDWPEDYKLHVKKMFKEAREVKEKMLAAGWESVCVEPGTISLEDWKKGVRPETKE